MDVFVSASYYDVYDGVGGGLGAGLFKPCPAGLLLCGRGRGTPALQFLKVGHQDVRAVVVQRLHHVIPKYVCCQMLFELC